MTAALLLDAGTNLNLYTVHSKQSLPAYLTTRAVDLTYLDNTTIHGPVHTGKLLRGQWFKHDRVRFITVHGTNRRGCYSSRRELSHDQKDTFRSVRYLFER
jgi:hypothetical protein